MAAILSVTYTPNYSGCHRICFRTSQASYCCYQDDTPAEIGVEKTTDIDLDEYAECLVDIPFEIGCIDTSVNGYVQPCCTDSASLQNRVSFSTAFDSTPCTTYNVECTESGIGDITINDPGYGWPIGVVPAITIDDSYGAGTGFSATANMNCVPGENFCSIGSITINDPGQGYYYPPTLSVDVSPLPTCISNELVVDGNFTNGLADWTVIPSDGWYMVGANARYEVLYTSSGAQLQQNILTTGKTYNISIGTAQVGSNTGLVRLIITAGLFNISGTASNQYMITRDTGDPIFLGPINVTLTSLGPVGGSVFSIYADCVAGDLANRIEVTDISVVEVCEAVDPELEIVLDDCGTFTVPECDGTLNPTTYEVLGAPEYAINVCSGGAGPVGPKYSITPNPPGASCCNCNQYNIVVRSPIDIYYTDCDQNIIEVSVEAGAVGLTFCAVPNSIWPVNKLDTAEILGITDFGNCAL